MLLTPSITLIASIITSAFALSNRLGSFKTIGQVQDEDAFRSLHSRDTDPALLYPEFNLSVPVDHFHNESKYEPHSDDKFDLRYWFDASHYKPGGPVIILQSGETNAADRLPYLQKGILAQLAQITNGISVVLEHRYYGTSFPTPDLSTKNLRFLTTQQALADEAYFARHISFPGLENLDLTANTTAYLGYGGSYPGAFNAFLRVLYPDIFWGTISSSGVTKAIYDYWEYYEPIRMYAPPKCVATQQTLIHIADEILLGGDDETIQNLKTAFGMPNVTHDDDFADQLSRGVQGWQSLNWDPVVSDPSFYLYCDNITSTSVLYPDTESLRDTAKHLISQTNYTAKTALVNQMLNFIGYVNLTAVQKCNDGRTQDQCFSQHNSTFYQQDSLKDDWRSWPYQYCVEWGYIPTGSGVPTNQLPLVSRLQDLEYLTIICREAFNITMPPDVEIINQYGGFDISYPRLAIIDGQWDPWRPATPHALEWGAKDRVSTASKPFIQIEGGVHHWDENGLFQNETTPTLPPQAVADVQKQIHQFVLQWMDEWRLKCMTRGGCAGMEDTPKEEL